MRISTDQSPSGLEEIQEALGESFAQRLPARIQGLRQALDDLSNGGGLEALRHLREQAHRLAGSGKMFGFPRVSVTASTLEYETLDWIDADEIPDEAGIERLHEAVSMVQSAAEDPLGEHG